MSGSTSIEWTDRNWPFARGCQRVSPGCTNCYAERMAARFSGPGLWAEGFATMTPAGPRWTGRVEFQPKELLAPLSVRKPSRFFPSTIDPFHEGITDEQLDQVFAVMALAARHTFQILTKRPERMLRYLTARDQDGQDARQRAGLEALGMCCDDVAARVNGGRDPGHLGQGVAMSGAEGQMGALASWPLPNVWLGVSVEDQQRADERIPLLLQTPAAVRWISAEPLLGPIQLKTAWIRPQRGCDGTTRGVHHHDEFCGPRLSWAVVGGESGAGARACDVAWIRSLLAQCKAAEVPAFCKQVGARPLVPACHQTHWDFKEEFGGSARFEEYSRDRWLMKLRDRKGADPADWPEWLRVREFPR